MVIAGGLVMGVGLIDDRWGLDALTKFAGQVTAASVMVTIIGKSSGVSPTAKAIAKRKDSSGGFPSASRASSTRTDQSYHWLVCLP